MTRTLALTLVTGSFIANSAFGAIVYDFNDGDAVVDDNTFGAGVAASDWLLTSPGGVEFHNGRANVAVRSGATMSFAVTVPDGVTLSLEALAFDAGFLHKTFMPNATTDPTWELTVSNGGAANPSSGISPGFDANEFGHKSSEFSIVLNGLTALTDTTVTFDFSFTTDPQLGNTLVRAHTMDNVTLTGGVVTEPGTLLGVGLGFGSLLLARRRGRSLRKGSGPN